MGFFKTVPPKKSITTEWRDPSPRSVTTQPGLAYLREKWSADDVPETEWMTLAKARTAIDALRLQGAAFPAHLDGITEFIERWSGHCCRTMS